MPITNQPIATNRTMGENASLFGVVNQTMIPGLAIGFLILVALQFVFDDYRKSAPIGGGAVIIYWFFVGNSKEKAWRNMSRFVPSPNTYIGSTSNASILEEYVQRSAAATVQEGRTAPRRPVEFEQREAPSGVA